MLEKIFSGGVDLGRADPIGLIIMAVGAAVCLFVNRKAENRIPTKLIGLIICAGGALLAILG